MKVIHALLPLLLICTSISTYAQEEAPEKEATEDVAPEKESADMEPKTPEFVEPAFAMDIEQTNLANSQGIANAFSIEILNADKKQVEKEWRQLMKSYQGKTKYSRKEAEMTTSNARVSEMGSNNYTVRAHIQEKGGNVLIHSWFENGDGYVETGEEADGVERLLNKFAVDVRKAMVDQELSAEEKNLKKAENELSKLKRQNDSYHKDIERAKKIIADSELKIIENEKLQVMTQEKIDGQRGIVEAVRKRLKLIE